MLLDQALALQMLGYRVVPVSGKRPVGKAWNEREWTEERLSRAFAGGADGLGLQLEGLLDIDGDGPNASAELALLDLPPTIGWQALKGPHRLFRLTPEQQARFNGQTRWKIGDLEVRTGAKLQSVIPPSPGRVWSGSTLLEALPALIPNLDWLPSPEASPSNVPNSTEPAAHRDDRPGDIYNAQATWEEILEPLGFTRVRERSEGDKRITDWRRSGTDKPLSATTGYCQSTGGEDRLYVFSTNCPPFEAEKSYDKFTAYTLVHHTGDFAAASAELGARGFAPEVSALVFPADAAPIAPRPVRLAVPEFPGLIEAIADWHCRIGRVADRTVGRVAGMMAVSWMLGRTAQLGMDGTRANLFALLTGRPGSGKTDLQHTLIELLKATGNLRELVLATASGEGLDDALSRTPRMLFIRDESQDLITELKDSAFKRSIPKTLKEMYSKSRSVHVPRSKANTKEEVEAIIHPYLTTLFLAGTSAIWDRMPEPLYRDGFIARLLVCEVDPTARTNRKPKLDEVPGAFLDAVRHWHGADMFAEAGPAEGEQAPALRDIPCTGEAEEALADLAEEWRFRPGPDTEAEFFTRGQEMTCKLCMIAAASLGTDAEVDRDMVDRMRTYVEASILRKVQAWEERFTGSEFVRVLEERIIGKLVRAGGPVYVSNLRYEIKGYTVEEFNDVVYGLLVSRRVVTAEEVTIDKRCVHKVKKIWLPLAAGRTAG